MFLSVSVLHPVCSHSTQSGWIPVGESHQSLTEQNPLGKQKPKDLPDDKQFQGRSLSLAPCEIKGVTRRVLTSHGVCCDEHVDAGQESCECSLTQQLHFHVDEEVPCLLHLPVQVHGAREAVELPRAEIAFLVSARDADDDVVARIGGRGSDAEDLSWDDDVGLEAQLVVRDA